jgi:hypothetical protein
MVIIAMPQVEAEQDDVVAAGGGGGAAGAAGEGVEDDIDDIDDPPPQALKAAMSKVHAAARNHRRRAVDESVGLIERCMEVLPVYLIVVRVSADLRGPGYLPVARRT